MGEAGIILATRDGERWQPQTSGTDHALESVHFADARTGWVVGSGGLRLRAGPPLYAPWIDEMKVKDDLAGNLEISFLVRSESNQTAPQAKVEYKTRNKPWESLEQTFENPDPDGRVRIKWSPANFGLATNQDIEYRVWLYDNGPPLAPFGLGLFRYQPWWTTVWQNYSTPILGFSGALALLAAYFGAFAIMLWLVPASLAGFGAAPGVDDIKKPDGNLATVIGLLQRVMQSLVLPWFSRSARVRRAWTRRYLDGRARIDQLSKPARESFLKEPDFLDAWVQERLDRVRAALDHLDLVRQRRVYISIPLRVDDSETGQMIDQPSVETLRQFFAPQRAIVAIVGDGGSGKSTLACALARWAMASRPEERLSPHQMLPVVVVEDTQSLMDSVARNLRRMLGDEELPEDLLRCLLAKQRLLIIVDALSERETATQRHIEALYDQGWPINALVITTRRNPDFKAVNRTILYPERLTGERLIPFIFEYLRRRKLDDLFPPRQQVQLGERVLELAESGGQKTSVTPLLVTLFIESAISRVRAGADLGNMPDQIPEVFLDYIRRVNPTAGDLESIVPNEELIPAACYLAIVSLGDNFVPSDFQQEDGLKAMATRANSAPAAKVLDRLIANGVLERREFVSIPLLRFSLDPAAEHLAAIARIEQFSADRDSWEQFLARVQNAASYPTECDGFLGALSACYKIYRKPFKLPPLDLPWE